MRDHIRWKLLIPATALASVCLGPISALDGGILPQQPDLAAMRGHIDPDRILAPDRESGDPRVVRVPDTPTLILLWNEPGAEGRIQPFCGVSLDGHHLDRIARADYEIGLRYACFDPLRDAPTPPDPLRADDVSLQIVQFVSPPLEVFRTQITRLGGVVHGATAQWSYLVEVSPDVRRRVANLPYVRWIGPYHPAYRLEETLVAELTTWASGLARACTVAPAGHETRAALRPDRSRGTRYNILVTDPARKPAVAARIESLGGVVDQPDAGKLLLSATLSLDQLARVACYDEVVFIDRWGPLEADMDIVREISGADYIETVAGYTGQGVRGEVFDTGFNLLHIDLQSPPLIQHGPVGTDFHGAATAGICFGDGTGQPEARGLLPDAQGIVADYHYVGLSFPGRYSHTAELLEEPYEAVFQSSTVGSPRTIYYTTLSAEMDAMLFDLDLVICQASGNSGDPNFRPEAWAKNIISVGGVWHENTLDRGDDHWYGGASSGPAADGRIAPTLIHFYDNIWTTSCCESTSYTTTFGGTSASTPIVAGCVGLVFQMWDDGIFGNEVDPGASVFDNRCHMTTARALLINTAYQYDFNGPGDEFERMHQGWGMPDLQTLYEMREKIYVIDETAALLPFETTQHLLWVESGEPALKATMTYTDPPGNPAVQSQHRINDLSLRLESPTGEVYHGNRGLLEGPWSQPGGDPDTKNTVECVYIRDPEPGMWTVEVSAPEIVEDARVETPEMDADYALVVTGVVPDPQAAQDPGPRAPAGVELQLAGRRPCRGEAELVLVLASAAHVRLSVHDVQGREVARLLDGPLPAGRYARVWSARDDAGRPVAPGVYFARVRAGDATAGRRILLLK